MSKYIRINTSLYIAAKKVARIEGHTIPHQIEFIKDILITKSMDYSLAIPFSFEGRET